MPSERERRFVGPRRGQVIFAVLFAVCAALLLSRIGTQTQWVADTRLSAQPRFWPAVGLVGMALLGGLHFYLMPWHRATRDDWREARRWLRVLEFAAWFMAYVLLVPILGYLPMSLIFVPLLALRMGYRGPRMMAISAGFALAVVVLFKVILAVRIPGGAVYEYLPDALRSVFILNF